MAEHETDNVEKLGRARRDYWLKQYAAAYAERDKRGAAIALQFAQADKASASKTDGQQK
jgi:hypothetical protein